MTGLDVFRLDGRVAFVTGGNRGLGLEMAKALASAGAAIAVSSRDGDRAEQAAAEIERATGRQAIGIALDVTDGGQAVAAMKTVVEKFGRIDILVNNAGVNVRKPVEQFDEASWDLVQDTNLKGPFLCARAAVPYMKEQRWGRIVNVASMLGLVALPERIAYCSSKGGLIQLTKVLALECAPFNVTVNALCPGPFATEINTVVLQNPEANRFFLDQIALGRWGKPEEIGGALIYLSSEASAFMTGSSLVIDGGWTAH